MKECYRSIIDKCQQALLLIPWWTLLLPQLWPWDVSKTLDIIVFLWWLGILFWILEVPVVEKSLQNVTTSWGGKKPKQLVMCIILKCCKGHFKIICALVGICECVRSENWSQMLILEWTVNASILSLMNLVHWQSQGLYWMVLLLFECFPSLDIGIPRFWIFFNLFISKCKETTDFDTSISYVHKEKDSSFKLCPDILLDLQMLLAVKWMRCLLCSTASVRVSWMLASHFLWCLNNCVLWI